MVYRLRYREQAERKLVAAQQHAQTVLNRSLESSVHLSHPQPHEQVEQQAMKWRAMVEEIRLRHKTVCYLRLHCTVLSLRLWLDL